MKRSLILLVSLLIHTTSQFSWTDIGRKIIVDSFHTFHEAYRIFEKNIWPPTKNHWRIAKEADCEYDFIIIGGGSAGGVVANRLSENPKWKILLLEDGDTGDGLMNIPTLAFAFQGTRFDWQYRTEKQPDMSLGIEKNQMPYPRGRVLGGSSGINYMMYVRGSKDDFNKWGEKNPGWSYDDVLPYFKKSENARFPNADPIYHGKDGPLSVEWIYKSKLLEAFIEGGKEIGFPEIDYNANGSCGFGRLQATTRKGRRDSVANAFLHPINKRKNLDILIGAFVTKIHINEKTKKAYGVEYENDNKRCTVLARKEVILSAGAINSPQLLMLSGIGPKHHLSEHGIRCIQDLPVGNNLQDHLIFYGLLYLIDFDIDQNLVRMAASFLNYVIFGKGPLTGAIEGVGFMKTSESTAEGDQPDVEFLFSRGSLASDRHTFSKIAFAFLDKVYDSVFKLAQRRPHWGIFPTLLYPKSKGNITLRCNNPRAPPLIYPNYFTDPENKDIKTMVEAILYIQKLGETKPFKENGARLNDLPVYGCEEHVFNSFDYWACALRTMAFTLYHQIGTTKMGPRDDPTAVVNSQLQVYGIETLRVCDAGVVPNQIGGHPNAAAIMIGEKCADYIKNDWDICNEI